MTLLYDDPPRFNLRSNSLHPHQFTPLSGCSTPTEPVDAQGVLSLLVCAVCDRILEKPVTLACGHSVCIRHLLGDHDDALLSSRNLRIFVERCPVTACNALLDRPMHPTVALTVDVPTLEPIVGNDVRIVQLVALALEHSSSDNSTLPPCQTPISHSPPLHDASPTSSSPEAQIQSPQERSDSEHSQPPSDPFSKALRGLLQCEICLNTLNEPVTTPCQHTFCTSCLQRSLDHLATCPLCRHDYTNVARFHSPRVNRIINSIISTFFATPSPTPAPDADDDLDTPIFVCQLSFPGMPTVLHIFEARYRLMLRRVLQRKTPQFGMIMYPSHEGTVVSYGTMLEIRSARILGDGRSIIETWGSYRFRIVRRGEQDGYMVGKVDRIDDLSEAMEREIERNATLPIPPRNSPGLHPLSRPLSPVRPPTSPHQSPTPSRARSPSIFPRPSILGRRRRSNSPTPSIASIASISTLSSINSAPPSSAPFHPQPPPSEPTTSPSRSAHPGSSSASSSPGSYAFSDRHAVAAAAPAAAPFVYPIEPTTEQLVETCHTFLQRLRKASSAAVIQRLDNVGPPPSDVGILSFWIAQLLPIDESEKAKLLPIRSPRLRLRLVVHWIDQFNSAWWFNGCVVA